MTDEQIKHMVDRFLGWKLPANFRPDCGIEFDADKYVKLNPRNGRLEPNGTNLFDFTQAEAMVEYMLHGLPDADATGAAEQQVGRAVYERLEALMDAKPGTPEGAELVYLADLVSSIEEYGSWDGPAATDLVGKH